MREEACCSISYSMMYTGRTKNKSPDLSIPLSEWIRPFQTFGNLQQQPTGGGGHYSAATTALPDDYLLPALQIACSLADQICQAKEESGQSPAPGSDWIDSIVVITDGDVRNIIRAELLPSLLSNTADVNNSGRAIYCGVIHSLGIVFYEIFSRGERPAGLERKQAKGGGPDGLQDQTDTEDVLESLDPLPFDKGDKIIDLE